MIYNQEFARSHDGIWVNLGHIVTLSVDQDGGIRAQISMNHRILMAKYDTQEEAQRQLDLSQGLSEGYEKG